MEKRKDIANIYIPPSFLQVWLKFGEIADREDSSKSELIRGFIARYVAVHDKGNPQLLLEKFTEPTKKICWKCRGAFPQLIHVRFLSGIKRRICKTCFEDYSKRKLVKKILK